MTKKQLWKSILIAAIIAGTADALAAILMHARPVSLHQASWIFRYIASGLFGVKANNTGLIYPISGLFLHYFIAFCWSAIYFLIISRAFQPRGILIKCFLFGTLIWAVMNGLVMPLAGLAARYDGWGIMRSCGIIILCVSLPIVAIAEKQRVIPVKGKSKK